MPKTLKNIALTLAMLLSALAAPLHAFEVSGESFPAEFNITSWTSNASGSAMTAEGIVGEGYGKVYLNYDFVSNSATKSGRSAARASTTTASWSQVPCKVFGNATVRSSPCIPWTSSPMAT